MGDRYQPYIKPFFDAKNPKEKGTYESLFNKLEETDKFITNWTNEDLDNFMYKTGSISVNTINKFLQYIKEIYEFVCEQENIQPKHLFLSYDLKEYIDLEKLIGVTLSEDHYKILRDVMTIPYSDGKIVGERNYRDKVLVELAWLGLTNNEIKALKEDDCVLYEEYGKVKMRLKLKSRNVIITDKDIIHDIEKCKLEDKYWLTQKNRSYDIDYKITPNLIKPVKMRQSDKDEVANPSMLLNRVLSKLEEEGEIHPIFKYINLSEISLEDIRRSKIIHMLKNGYSVDDIQEVFGRNNSSDLHWIKDFADFLKKKEDELKKQKQSN